MTFRIADNYFHMFREMGSSRTTTSQKCLALLEICSLFTVVVPLVFGAIYLSLAGRVKEAAATKIQAVVRGFFGRKKADAERRHVLSWQMFEMGKSQLEKGLKATPMASAG